MPEWLPDLSTRILEVMCSGPLSITVSAFSITLAGAAVIAASRGVLFRRERWGWLGRRDLVFLVLGFVVVWMLLGLALPAGGVRLMMGNKL
jgi:hypothetical protein